MLNQHSPLVVHRLQNLALVLLSLCALPFTTVVLAISYAVSQKPSPQRAANRRTVLVTGVSMTKGLFLARAFCSAGHTVIAADFSATSAGRFSRAVSIFYVLQNPSETTESKTYTQGLVDIIKKHDVSLWVSCSGVASAIQDAEAKEAVEKLTKCKCVQFNVAQTEVLHAKDKFIKYVESLNLQVPETHVVRSADEARIILYESSHSEKPNPPGPELGRHFILKCIGVDDVTRDAIATLLPRQTEEETISFLKSLHISDMKPFVLQQFIKGREFCTHALVVGGSVRAFCACPSSDMLMHYEALPPKSALSKAMLDFTRRIAEDRGQTFTGHLSFDFLVVDSDLERAKQQGLKPTLYPIECNPRAHTAVRLFKGLELELVDAYMSLLEVDEAESPPFRTAASEQQPKAVVTQPLPSSPKIYWAGHDMVTLILLPLISLVTRSASLTDAHKSLQTFQTHLRTWEDGTYETRDPLPWWILYQLYWPVICAHALLKGKCWSRINVSTGKIFEC